MRTGRNSWSMIIAVGLVVLLVVVAAYAKTRGDRKYTCLDCNVVLITVDTLRSDHLSLYGYGRETTPNLDGFFGDKSVFLQASSSAPCTRPSVLQYLTGRFNYNKASKRIAQVLNESGYKTAAVVSQHFFGWEPKPRGEYARGFSYFNIQNTTQKDRYGMTSRNATEVTNLAINWIEENKDGGKLFLWLHYFDPHDPYSPPKKFLDKDDASSSLKGGDVRRYLKKGRKRGEWWADAGHVFNEQERWHFIARYDSEIRYVDYEAGRVLDKLADSGLLENTIIVFSSDHGENLGENNRWDHCRSLHRRETSIPLLFSVKNGKLKDYGRYNQPVSTLDIFPTILGLLNITYENNGFDGINLLAASENRKVQSRWKGVTSIKKGAWKLYYRKKPERLYNTRDDENETKDLLGKHPEIAVELMRETDKQKEPIRDREKSDKEIIKELKSVGYI